MQRYPKRKIYYFGGLLAIVLVYSFYYIYILDPLFIATSAQMTRRILRVVSFFLVYGIGLAAIRQGGLPHWLVRTWHILYGTGLLIVVVCGLCAGWLPTYSQSFLDLTFTFLEFLISPVLYVIVGIIDRIARQ